MEIKVLFLQRDYKKKDGGSVVTERNIRYFEQLENPKVVLERIVLKENILSKILNILLLKPYGSNFSKINSHIIEFNPTIVFLDHAFVGAYAKNIKKTYPEINTITFTQNVELSYSISKLKVEGLQNIPIIIRSYFLERKAYKFSDSLICMTKRDQQQIESIFRRKNSVIIPTSLPEVSCSFEDKSKKEYILFVGSYFFANVEGIKWYIENVLPQINYKLKVVGSGMSKLESSTNNPLVEFIDFVEDLSELYQNALYVINPVNFGSGMKTKTIEAIRYGKVILGSKECFIGVEKSLLKKIGFLCVKKDEYINIHRKIIKNKIQLNSQKSIIETFNENYSDKVVFESFNKVLKKHLL